MNLELINLIILCLCPSSLPGEEGEEKKEPLFQEKSPESLLAPEEEDEMVDFVLIHSGLHLFSNPD